MQRQRRLLATCAPLERSLRVDLPCGINACSQCASSDEQPLRASATHIVVPAASTAYWFAPWLSAAYAVASDVCILRSTLEACGSRLPRALADLSSSRQTQQRVAVFEDVFHAGVAAVAAAGAASAGTCAAAARSGDAEDATMSARLGGLHIAHSPATPAFASSAALPGKQQPMDASFPPSRMLCTLSAAAWLARHFAVAAGAPPFSPRPAAHNAAAPPIVIVLVADDVVGPASGVLGGSVLRLTRSDAWEAAGPADALLTAAFPDVRVSLADVPARLCLEQAGGRAGVAVLSLSQYAGLFRSPSPQPRNFAVLPESLAELMRQLVDLRTAAVAQATARLRLPSFESTAGGLDGDRGIVGTAVSQGAAAEWLLSRAGHLFPAHITSLELESSLGRSLQLSPRDALRLLGPDACALTPSATSNGIQLLRGTFHRSRTARDAGWVEVGRDSATFVGATASVGSSAGNSFASSAGCGRREVKVIGDVAQNRALDGDTVVVACLPLAAVIAAVCPYYATGRPLGSWARVSQCLQRCSAAPAAGGSEAALLDVLDVSPPQDSDSLDAGETGASFQPATSSSSLELGDVMFGVVLGIERRSRGLVVATPQANDGVLASDLGLDPLRSAAPVAVSVRSAQAPSAEPSSSSGGGASEDVSRGGTLTRILVVPMDEKLPKVRVLTRQPIRRLVHHRLLVHIDEWPSTSLYPSGHYVSTLGKCLDVDTEVRCIMLTSGVDAHSRHFPRAALDCLPVLPPASQRWSVAWHILQRVRELRRTDSSLNVEAALHSAHRELAASRRDLRWSHAVCSVDPPGCTDIDDALSVHTLPSGNIEIGVHIADVTAFVGRGSDLDVEARARATTVYLVDRRCDMLPRVLSENVCSLRARVDRFAVSMLWELRRLPSDPCGTPKYEVLQDRTWIGRSIVRSTHALTYDQAKHILAACPAEEDQWVQQQSAGAERRFCDPDLKRGPPEGRSEWVDPLEADCADDLGLAPRMLDPASYLRGALDVRQRASHVYVNDPPEGGNCGASVAPEDERGLASRLQALASVAQWLASKRTADGAVGFDSAEVRFVLQRKGGVPRQGGGVATAASSVSFSAALAPGPSKDGANYGYSLPRSTTDVSEVDGLPASSAQDCYELDEGPEEATVTTASPAIVEPIAAASKHAEDINNMIAELMIFANEAAAKLTFAVFPALALLRGHAAADSSKFGALRAAAGALGVVIDTTSNETLGRTLKSSSESVEARGGKAQAAMLHALALRAMSRAEYFVSSASTAVSPSQLARSVLQSYASSAAHGSVQWRKTEGGAYCDGVMSVTGPPEYGHYGLALNLYTHFTSPIRRYADNVVHTLIIAALATAHTPVTAATTALRPAMSLPLPSLPRPALPPLPPSAVASPLAIAQWQFGDRPAPMSLREAAGVSPIPHAGFSQPLLSSMLNNPGPHSLAPFQLGLRGASLPTLYSTAEVTKTPELPALQEQPFSSHDLSTLAVHLNERNQSAKEASWACNELFLALYLRSRVHLVEGVVTRVAGDSRSPLLQVFIPFYNITASVRFVAAEKGTSAAASSVHSDSTASDAGPIVIPLACAASAGHQFSCAYSDVALSQAEGPASVACAHRGLSRETRGWLCRLPLNVQKALVTQGAVCVSPAGVNVSAIVDSEGCTFSVRASSFSADQPSATFSLRELDRVIVALYCLWDAGSARRPPLIADFVADTPAVRELMSQHGGLVNSPVSTSPEACLKMDSEIEPGMSRPPEATPSVSLHSAALLAASSSLHSSGAFLAVCPKTIASVPMSQSGPLKRLKTDSASNDGGAPLRSTAVVRAKGRASYGGFVPPAELAPHDIEMRMPDSSMWGETPGDDDFSALSALTRASGAYADVSRAMAGASHPMFGGGRSGGGDGDTGRHWGVDPATVLHSGAERVVFGGSHGYGSEARLETPVDRGDGVTAYSVRTGAGLSAGGLLSSTSDLTTVQRAALARADKVRAERRNDRKDKLHRKDK